MRTLKLKILSLYSSCYQGLVGINKIEYCGSNAIKYMRYFMTNSKEHEENHFSCPTPELDEEYFCNPKNRYKIIDNISKRKGIGDNAKVLHLCEEFSQTKSRQSKEILYEEMLKIPNETHPDVVSYGEIPKILKTIGNEKNFDFKPKEFHEIAKAMNLLRNDISNFTGHRSYFLINTLSKLETAIIKYSLFKLLNLGFKIVSVPDILPRSVIEGCGMETLGKRSQVYRLNPIHENETCLSGTAEMALAAYLINTQFESHQLPIRLAAVSRCYRAETSRTSEERGIYRVHQFTKVEMFGVCEPEESATLLDEFREFQVEHFSSLGLQLRVLDMPPHELGAQAYRKYDVEAWLPGKEMWAELSSCSNCTDYQSRRLAIRNRNQFLHTVNGTACAAPRLIIALFETHQQSDGSVQIPEPLQSFMSDANHISKENSEYIPKLRPIRRKSKMS